jgi:hypothetical protein
MTIHIPAWVLRCVGGGIAAILMLLGLFFLWLLWKGRKIDMKINW